MSFSLRTLTVLLIFAGVSGHFGVETQAQAPPSTNGEWVSLFDGESLDGWRASEHDTTFSVEDGRIVAHGPRAHLFYDGPIGGHNFKDFEFRADVMTMPGSNSGIYFHTEYQEEGWPSAGYEVQVNNTYESDPRRTGSLYGVQDVHETAVDDNEWFRMYVRVRGPHVVVEVDDERVVDYTVPEEERSEEAPSGTFALQGHDPESKVYYKNIFVNPLE